MRLVIDLQGAQGVSRWRGIGRYCRELALAMAKEPRDHEVVVVLNGIFMDTAEELQAAFSDRLPDSHIRTWYPPSGLQPETARRDFAETLRAQFLASLRPDLLYVGSIFEGLGEDIVTLPPPRLERLPTVGTCFDLIPMIRHGEYFGNSDKSTLDARWYYRCAQELALCDGLLAISKSSRDEAIRYLAYPEERAFNILTGISSEFRPTHLSQEELRSLLHRYRLRDSFILYLGAGDPRKNEKGLIAAYARLPLALRKRHQLVIVGKVDESSFLKQAAEHGISKEDFVLVHFVPEEDLNALYTHCGLFVYPSLHEGFGLPLGEAMACGAPAIASNTTSLPEVIGREDVTFAPEDPDSIAACMRKVLENPSFRQDLAEYGPVQAGRFTWQASATRAWDALEAINARRTHRDKPRVGSMLAKRPRLAFASPLPPQASGIADYSAELLPSLARYYDITLVSEDETTDHRLWAFPRLTPQEFLAQPGAFDRVVYQVGNSHFHRYQLEMLMPRCPGMVVLHDAFLADVMHWMAHARGCFQDFRTTVLQSHGYPALRFLAEHGVDATMSRYPCSIAALQNAVGVIQHSRHGIDILREHFSREATEDIALVPLLRMDRQRPDRKMARAALGLDEDTFVVCTFGIVHASKRPDLIAEAWRRSGIRGRLAFVGDCSDWRDRLVNAALGIDVSGRVSREDYDNWLAAADLAVQCRATSRGESSAAIGDALMAGVPLIINRHGSAAELPDDIVFGLPDDANASELAAALVTLHNDPARRKALGVAGRSYAQQEFDPTVIARRYSDAIEKAYATAGSAVVVRDMQANIQAMVDGSDSMSSVARSIANSFPSPWRGGGRPQLWMDISALSRHNGPATASHPSLCEVTRRVLETPPKGWRGEAVRLHAGRLRRTYTIPLVILDHAPVNIQETPVDVSLEDILLYTDINNPLSAEEFSELRRLRLAGMRMILAAFDRVPLVSEAQEKTPAAESFCKMLGIADGVVCVSSLDVDRVMAWLDDRQDCRKVPLRIGLISSEGNSLATAPDWDRQYRDLCDIILEDRWDRVWRP